MNIFVNLIEFEYWLSHHCEEPFPIVQMEMEFESCMWIPLDYIKNLLSPTSVSNLLKKVNTVEETTLNL